MAYSSKIIEAFEAYDKFDHQNEMSIEKVIAEKIKAEFNNMRTHIQIPLLNYVLKKHYIDPSIKTDAANQLYSSLKIDQLLSKETRSVDNLESLKDNLKTVRDTTTWEKYNYNLGAFPNNAPWFSYHIGKVIAKIEDDQGNDSICAEIISLLYKFILYKYKSVRPNQDNPPNDFEITQDDYIFDPWFEKAIQFFRTDIPNLFNSAVYAYFLGMLLNRYPGAVPHLEYTEEELRLNFDFQSVIASKQFYKRLVSLVIVNQIHSELSNHIVADFTTDQAVESNDSENEFHVIDKILLQRVDTYLLSGSNWPVRNLIATNQKPHKNNHFRKTLFFSTFASLLSYVRQQENASKFMSYIGFRKQYNEIEWSFMNSVFNTPTEDELTLLNLLRLSFVQPKKSVLELFTQTEHDINYNSDDSNIKDILARIKSARSIFDKKNRATQIVSVLTDLVSMCEKIEVDFASFDVEFGKKDCSNDRSFIISLLRKCEKEHIRSCQNDIFLAQDVKNWNPSTIKAALQYRSANNLNLSILDIYEKVIERIKENYFADTNLVKTHTEQDLINKLNDYAWYKLENDLHDERQFVHSAFFLNPRRDFFEKNEEKNFFQKAEILSFYSNNNDLQFFSNNELWVCAGAGFAREKEETDPDIIKQDFIKLLTSFCQVDCQNIKSHLDYSSRRFLAFGLIGVSFLPAKKRDRVIDGLCKYAREVVAIKDRPTQQIMHLLLNLLIIQPDISLCAKQCEEIFDTIYNRTLYPQEMLALERIKEHPFLNSMLNERMSRLSSPKVENGLFPCPFSIYLYAAQKAFEIKEKHDDRYFKEEHLEGTTYIILNNTINLKDIDVFYLVCVLLQGISWRLINRDYKKETSVKPEVLQSLFDQCSAYWGEYKNEGATDNTLKLTWATQLLLTSFSNLAREDFLPCTGWNHTQIISLAVLGDYYQRLYTKGYQNFLTGESAEEFFILSSAMRYTSVLCRWKAKVQNFEIDQVKFTFPDDNMVRNYISWLSREKNARFLILTLRYLTFTDFFTKISRGDWESIKQHVRDIQTLSDVYQKPKDYFLPYDEIEVDQIKDIMRKTIN